MTHGGEHELHQHSGIAHVSMRELYDEEAVMTVDQRPRESLRPWLSLAAIFAQRLMSLLCAMVMRLTEIASARCSLVQQILLPHVNALWVGYPRSHWEYSPKCRKGD